MKYKNFLIRLFDLILVLGLLAGYQAVIYSRDKEATIAELKSQVNQLQGEKEREHQPCDSGLPQLYRAVQPAHCLCPEGWRTDQHAGCRAHSGTALR